MKSNYASSATFNGGQTTIRRNSTRKVFYDQVEGDFAHCSIYDKDINRLILNESVLNGGIYQLFRFGEHVFLEPKGKSKEILVGEKINKNLLAESTDDPTVKTPDPTAYPTSDSTTARETSVPNTPIPTSSRPEVLEPTRRSTRKPLITTSVQTTTKPKIFKVEYFDIALKSERCKWYQSCEWKTDYRPLIQNAQGH